MTARFYRSTKMRAVIDPRPEQSNFSQFGNKLRDQAATSSVVVVYNVKRAGVAAKEFFRRYPSPYAQQTI